MSEANEIKMGRAVTNAVDNESSPRHRWYPIKEGFSPTLVSDSLKELDESQRKSALAIEPFSGSGTAPVECTRLGVDCLGLEVNPFLAFVGRTKLRQADPEMLRCNRERVLLGLRNPVVSPLEDHSTFCEGNGKDKWLFNRNVLRTFTGGWNAIAECSSTHRDFLRLALVRATMENCNAYPDGKCLRYKRLKNYSCFNAASVIAKFEHYCDQIEEDLAAQPFTQVLSRVECMDARKLKNFEENRRFDFCVTSPPYLNSFDYSDVYRPELFLTGAVTNNQELMQIRLRTVRSHVQADWTAPVQNSFGVHYAKIIADLQTRREKLWTNRILDMVQAYFEDMESLLTTLGQRANPNALLKIAVGTSAYGGVVVPVDFILAEIAEKVGWELKDVQVVRRIRSSAQNWKHQNDDKRVPELRESLIVLRYPKY
ncbi:MAG: hypothetical protein JO295_03925 [Verrucomicrobia bacterium]|nr:hypothetical protein [Verrucomicrobiota bacterium]